LSDADARRLIRYAGPDPLLFQASIRTNLLFALNRAEEPEVRDTSDRTERQRLREAARSGNPLARPSGDWLDHDLLPAMTEAERDAALMRALADVGLAADVSRLGLRAGSTPRGNPRWRRRFSQAGRRSGRRSRPGEWASSSSPSTRSVSTAARRSPRTCCSA
jgi:hypothetical protein